MGRLPTDEDLKNYTPYDTEPSKNGSAPRPIDKFTVRELVEKHPRLNPPVVDGLFREQETINIISTSKAGKSWLLYGLILSIITGRKWLDTFETSAGACLLIDNELHKSTLAYRIPEVAYAMGIKEHEYMDALHVWPLRGNLRSIWAIEDDLHKFKPGTFRAVFVDAKYRMQGEGKGENDNSTETQLYNTVDYYAEGTRAAWGLVHHASKGNQSDRRVTDVGAGAGAQSRATDCHLVLREHEEPDCVVLEAAIRSFKPVQPLALRWRFPLWVPADDIDPTKLKGRLTQGEQRQTDKDRDGEQKLLDALSSGPATVRDLRGKTGLSRERCNRLLDVLESDGRATWGEVTINGGKGREYRLCD